MADGNGVLRVLVVDDEPDVEMMFRQRMRREVRSGRYELFFAQSGQEALAVLADHPEIRLVCTDLNMPIMGGLELLNRLEGVRPDVRAIVVSAYGDPVNQSKALDSGASGFVAKPVDFAGLKDLLERM